MKPICALVIAFVMSVAIPSFAQQHSRPNEQAYAEPEAYAVYSALLSDQSVWLSSHRTLVIRANTSNAILNVPSFPIDECFSAKDRVPAEAIQDFMRVNKQQWRLQDKFVLTRPYRVSQDAAQWFIELSAVGFNAMKNVAVVRVGMFEAKQTSGGLNADGESEVYALRKEQGKWMPIAHGCHSTGHTFDDGFEGSSR